MSSEDTTYNGWTNYETWNINLWITGDEGFYSVAKVCKSYEEFIELMHEINCYTTPDHVGWDLPCVNRREINDSWDEL